MIESKDGVPYSALYDDIYYSREDGLAESRYIFLQGNDLETRLKSNAAFTIAECGFGTGLNFLATCELLASLPARAKPLHFISIEKHPFPQDELKLIYGTFLNRFPELATHSERLLKSYPVSCAGVHRICLPYINVYLDLYFLDVEEALKQIQCKIDAWFLDGFAPGKNPAMWSQSVFQHMATLSKENTTVATFTAAGLVKQGLTEAGFEIKKISGFGRKRENLTAKFCGSSHNDETKARVKPTQPWFHYASSGHKNRTVTVIGAGIAGCQIAHHLAKKGWQITLVEQDDAVAQRASGNPAGVVAPKVGLSHGLGEQFYVQCFQYLLNQLAELRVDAKTWTPCGVLQLLYKDDGLKRWAEFHQHPLAGSLFECVTAETASELSGVSITSHGLFFPHAGYLSPKLFCEKLLQYSAINRCLHTAIKRIERVDNVWQIFDDKDALVSQSDVVVVATGRPAAFITTEHFPCAAVRGQSSVVDATENTHALATVVDHDGYVTPAINGKHSFGASYQINDTSIAAKQQDDRENFQKLCDQLPVFSTASASLQTAHTALRTTTPDRLPYVGAVPDFDFYQRAYSDLRHGKHWKQYEEARYVPGLFISAGYGSRGLTTTALCSEMLAFLINNEPLPTQASLTASLHPARFFIKQLKQAS